MGDGLHRRLGFDFIVEAPPRVENHDRVLREELLMAQPEVPNDCAAGRALAEMGREAAQQPDTPAHMKLSY